MKKLYFITAIAIFNLIGVTFISNLSKANIHNADIAIPSTTPTPITVVKKIVKKVIVTATPLIQKELTQNISLQQIAAKPTQPSQNSQPTTQSNSNPTSPPSNKCIITVDGVSYDVTDFRNQHSGGNIFNCGTDMSQIFWSQHNAGILSKMQQYRI